MKQRRGDGLPRKIGCYDIGTETIELAVRSGTGASFSTRSDKQHQMPEIVVGLDGDWPDILGRLLHEAKEFCDMRLGCRWVPDVDYARDAAGYTFIETHGQHSEICARVAVFISQCLGDLEKAWNEASSSP